MAEFKVLFNNSFVSAPPPVPVPIFITVLVPIIVRGKKGWCDIFSNLQLKLILTFEIFIYHQLSILSVNLNQNGDIINMFSYRLDFALFNFMVPYKKINKG